MKKFILFFMLLLFSCCFLTGCLFNNTGSQSTDTPSPSPSCSSIYIVSNCRDCSGTIIINDRNTGIHIAPWGGTFVTAPEIHCGELIRVNILNKSNVLSHTEARTATAPQTIIQFDWFK